jgi:hypothetical protein
VTIGILAFGSIVDQPGTELEAATVRLIDVETPFMVEYARSSRTRDGAPTLVPVNDGGAHLPAKVLVLDESVSVSEAREMLYRRETGLRGDSADRAAKGSWIAGLTGFAGLDTCLYAALGANISPLTAGKLAELAIKSASSGAGAQRRDGISYLDQQQRRGLVTPLTGPYEAAVLAQTGAQTLAEAWARVRENSRR